MPLLDENNISVEDSKQDVSEQDVIALLKENIELSRRILEDSEKMRSYIHWQNTLGLIKFLIFVIPLVLGLIYLPPLMTEIWRQYQDILGLTQGVGAAKSSIPLDLPPDLLRYLNK